MTSMWWWRYAVAVSISAAALVAKTAAQETAPATAARASQATTSAVAEDANSVLKHVIRLQLQHVSLEQALKAIANEAGVRIAYGRRGLALEQPVTIVMERVSVGEALRDVLAGTDVVPVIAAPGLIALEPDGKTMTAGGPVPQGTATIAGYVRDSATGTSITHAMVRIDGTAFQVTSSTDGTYQISGVPAGEYRVTARRVGYIAHTRTITITDGEAATLNFGLNPPATKLDEVVTTALGEQRRYQVGNVISTLNVDSIAPTAPVTSVTDLLSARVPGLEVVETSGLVGSGEALRIRGQSSLVLQADPIIVVDGIRQDNTSGGRLSGLGDIVPSPSRLNDIDFSQIETIDVLKGPAASTEYGTDAANGVIVITTKHGVNGRPQWHVSAEQDGSTVPTGFPEYYYSWGHTTDGVSTTGQCALLPLYAGVLAQYGPPYDIGSTYGTCVVDSVTHFDPLNHTASSIYGPGNQGRYDASVSGGSEAFRYYATGGLTNALGTIRLPAVFHSAAQALGFPASAFQPNGENQRSARGNTVIRLGSTDELTLNTAYMSTYQESPRNSSLVPGPAAGPDLPDSAHNYGYGAANGNPLTTLGMTQSQVTDQLTTGATDNWQPVSWLVAHAIVGLDHESQTAHDQTLPQAFLAAYGPSFVNRGSSALTAEVSDVYTVDLRTTATVSPSSALRLASSLGLQLADSRSSGVSAEASGLSATNLTLNGAANLQVTQLGDRSATLGGYGEEVVSVSDRLFLTAALRIDAGSGFGRAYHTASYPKASVSWLAVQDGGTTVRLRGALGASGVQPNNGAALQLYNPIAQWLNGRSVSVVQLQAPGDPDLQPERSIEYEGGADLGLWTSRVNLELTAYSKTTQNALFDQTLGLDVNNFVYEENIGEIRNTGLEATLTATVIQASSVSWSLTFNASLNSNQLVQLAAGAIHQNTGNSSQFQVPGYPVYGDWGARTSYMDLNRDGIITPGEVAISDTASFLGSSSPTRELSLATGIGLWHSAVSVGAVLDYKGGYRIFNDYAFTAAGSSNLPEQNLLGSPEWLQARTITQSAAGFPSSFFENGTFLRFRELSLTYTVPRSWLRTLHMRTLGITGAVRNLALWTRYTGTDPETSSEGSTYNAISNVNTVNNDLRQDFGAVPLVRTWFVRFNVGI